jgi:hypothetical protein
MHTPAHVVLNAALLGRGCWRAHWGPITAGALLPDLPLVVFYLYERLVAGTSERLIWSQAYFEPDWQACFDLSHSLPLIALAALLAWRLRAQAWLACLASMALHSVADLALHHEDAHAHLLPISSWRFRSPVSYWDPVHHGTVTLAAELVLVLAGSAALLRRSEPRGWRAVGGLTLGSYAALAVLAGLAWARG